MAGRRSGGAAAGGGGSRTGGSSLMFVGRQPTDLAQDMRRAGPSIRRAMSTSLRRSGQVAGDAMRMVGSSAMPHRGGLSGLARNSDVNVSTRGFGSSRVTVEVGLSSPDVNMADLNAGVVHHPTYGRRPFVAQTVPAGTFSRPAVGTMPRLRADLSRSVSDAIRRIAN